VTQDNIGRFPIASVWPSVDGGKYSAKAFVSEVIQFGAVAFREGHDALAVELVLTSPNNAVTRHPMHPGAPGLDQWLVDLQLTQQGQYLFQIAAFDDEYETWHHNTEVKLAAGIDQELMILEGKKLAERFAAVANSKSKKSWSALLAIFEKKQSPAETFEDLMAAGFDALAKANPLRNLETLSAQYAIDCERKLAGSGSWYEFFPRSEGAKKDKAGKITSGNFKTAIKSLDRVVAMGFDVLYLPPVHPIGTAFKKGKNNTLNAGSDEPGSPWAIGNTAGGHDTIHPDLGTDKDFKAFVVKANKMGLEIAMDLALQASPDHPWVKTNPEFFTTRADGSIAYAENPPKKYQDIYPVNFDNDPQGVFDEVLRVTMKWISFGVKIFRVDNPHTKPVGFWQELISKVREIEPDVIFLAEAFTRPAMMHALGKVGFQQSYTYFTWRNTKAELESYLTELASESADFFRPNLWVNTPDILTQYLQYGGRPAFNIRAIIAATAGSSWGMYAGYELYESVARPGAEENIDNEKYEYKFRDFDAAIQAGNSLAPRVALLNQIRKAHPALQQLRNLKTHKTDDQSILCYSKHLSATTTGKADTVIVVVNTDPASVRETVVHLDLAALELSGAFKVKDLLTGKVYDWAQQNYVRLDSFTEPAHIFEVIR
jgi:starch synthase (maltosyl-transferring)